MSAHKYPRLHQWLRHGGSFSIRQCGSGLEGRLGDAGGFAWTSSAQHPDLESTLLDAEQALEGILKENKELLNYLAEQHRAEYDGGVTISVTGWPSIPNPNHENST